VTEQRPAGDLLGTVEPAAAELLHLLWLSECAMTPYPIGQRRTHRRTYASVVPRRRAGVLLPLEEAILEVGLRRLRDSEAEFYGFAMATELDEDEGRSLTAHGTLYKVLERLERNGLLVSRWEEGDEVEQGRPRRRLYQVSDQAEGALRRSRRLQTAPMLLRGLASR
jgi:PadR family transcriptional regulator, regulatory protein PadR